MKGRLRQINEEWLQRKHREQENKKGFLETKKTKVEKHEQKSGTKDTSPRNPTSAYMQLWQERSKTQRRKSSLLQENFPQTGDINFELNGPVGGQQIVWNTRMRNPLFSGTQNPTESTTTWDLPLATLMSEHSWGASPNSEGKSLCTCNFSPCQTVKYDKRIFFFRNRELENLPLRQVTWEYSTAK